MKNKSKSYKNKSNKDNPVPSLEFPTLLKYFEDQPSWCQTDGVLEFNGFILGQLVFDHNDTLGRIVHIHPTGRFRISLINEEGIEFAQNTCTTLKPYNWRQNGVETDKREPNKEDVPISLFNKTINWLLSLDVPQVFTHELRQDIIENLEDLQNDVEIPRSKDVDTRSYSEIYINNFQYGVKYYTEKELNAIIQKLENERSDDDVIQICEYEWNEGQPSEWEESWYTL